MRSGEIKALTGLRLFAAIWVVLFHFRPLLAESIPDINTALAPILNSGAQGVDLFFILSGFVLAWNYLDRMGPTWSTRDTLHFLWMRLARVWPVYLVTLHLAALWIIFTLYVGRFPSEVADTLTATSYLRQLFLVQLWYLPYFDGSSWNGPAWSISAEWLAYLIFGFLALVVFRMAAATRARSLLLLSFAATLPPVMFLLASGQFYTPWSWLPRILMQFTAGVIACAAVRRLYPSDRARTAAGLASIALVATIIGSLYWLDEHPIPGVIDSGGVVDLLFVPLVVTLSIGAGTLPWLLSHRILIYGGQISFSLYMVHELIHTAWIWAAKQFELTMAGPGGVWWLVAVFAITLTASAALYHVVEEPARIWMRRMVGRKKPAASVRAVDSETRLSA